MVKCYRPSSIQFEQRQEPAHDQDRLPAIGDQLVERARNVIDGLLSSPDITDVAELEPGDEMMARRIWAPTSRDKVFTVPAGDEIETRLAALRDGPPTP